MKKIIMSLLVMFILCGNAYAKKINNNFDKIIEQSGISKNSISISIKNLDTQKTKYILNDKILMHPASVQKILTLPAIVDVLGDDYNLSTGLYQRGKNKYIIKLGADPYLTTPDLKTLIKEINPKTIEEIYIDPSIIEPKDWGEGWQWDDDLNICMPKFNAYNLDSNIAKITVMLNNGKIIIINPAKYPFNFINNVVAGENNSINLRRNVSLSPDTLEIAGTIKDSEVIHFPQNNLKHYFEIRLKQSLMDRNIFLNKDATTLNILDSDKLIKKITHPISQAEDDILKNSNNMYIETLAKLASAKAYKKTGTDVLGIKLAESYFKKLGMDTSRIRISDASGVSKNNLVDADFVTTYLIKIKDNNIISKMATAGEGTLSDRMIPLKGNLKAKTGTLSDISSIAGFLTSKSGNNYVFCIIINDPSSQNSDKKNLENYLIRELYLKG